jgi:hypothetical protein
MAGRKPANVRHFKTVVPAVEPIAANHMPFAIRRAIATPISSCRAMLLAFARSIASFASRRVREAMAVTTYGIGYAPCRAFIREATELTPLGELKLRSSQAESPRHYLAQADISRGPASTEPVARPHVATLTATIPWPRSNMIIWATIDVRCGHRRVAPTYRLTGY